MSAPSKSKQMSVRLSESTDHTVETLARETGVSQSLVVRAMLATAENHRDEVVARIEAQL